MRPPRVVFDTNVFVSGILFGGNPRRCIELARKGEIELFTSKALLAELGTKLQQKFAHEKEDADEVIQGIAVYAKIIESKYTEHRIEYSPDNHVLEVAGEEGVDYIVTGDKKHILPLKKHKTAKILTPANFLKELQNKKSVV